MAGVVKKSLIKVSRAYWHVDRKESCFELKFRDISGRQQTKVVRLPEIEELQVFRRRMAEFGFSFFDLPRKAADIHAALMRQCRYMAEDRDSEYQLTSELGWHDGAFVLPNSTYPDGAHLSF